MQWNSNFCDCKASFFFVWRSVKRLESLFWLQERQIQRVLGGWIGGWGWGWGWRQAVSALSRQFYSILLNNRNCVSCDDGMSRSRQWLSSEATRRLKLKFIHPRSSCMKVLKSTENNRPCAVRVQIRTITLRAKSVQFHTSVRQAR